MLNSRYEISSKLTITLTYNIDLLHWSVTGSFCPGNFFLTHYRFCLYATCLWSQFKTIFD